MREKELHFIFNVFLDGKGGTLLLLNMTLKLFLSGLKNDVILFLSGPQHDVKLWS